MKVPAWVHNISLKTEQLNQACKYIASIYYRRVGAESLRHSCATEDLGKAPKCRLETH